MPISKDKANPPETLWFDPYYSEKHACLLFKSKAYVLGWKYLQHLMFHKCCLHNFYVSTHLLSWYICCLNKYFIFIICLSSYPPGRCPRQDEAFADGRGAVGRTSRHSGDTPTRVQLLPQWRRWYPSFSPISKKKLFHPINRRLITSRFIKSCLNKKCPIRALFSCVFIGCPRGCASLSDRKKKFDQKKNIYISMNVYPGACKNEEIHLECHWY